MVLAAAASLSPAVVVAQQTAAAPEQRTHTVKKKDTLWDIARSYLGDPFQWPEIYRINRDVVEDPHWIYPGEVLKISGSGLAKATIADAAPLKEEAKEESKKEESKAKEEPAVLEVQPAAEPPMDPNSATIFMQAGTHRDQPRTMTPSTRESTLRTRNDEPPPPTIRFGEFLAAPYVDQRGGPRGSGRIIERADLSPAKQNEQQNLFQLYDRVLVAPPVAEMAPEGERFVSYTFGPYIERVGQVIIPTGIVQITRAPRRGEAAIAKVVRIFSEVRPDQKLMPYDSSALALRGRAQPVSEGRWASVKWISSEPVMPSVQNYLVLNISAREGVQLGDEFQLFRPRRPADEPNQLAKPEIAIGRAQVVRVTPFGTTVIVTGQEQPKIEQGTMARMSAKMP